MFMSPHLFSYFGCPHRITPVKIRARASTAARCVCVGMLLCMYLCMCVNVLECVHLCVCIHMRFCAIECVCVCVYVCVSVCR